HADGEGQYRRPMVFALDRKMFPINTCLKYAVDRTEKIVTVRLNMKADQVRAEQAIQQLLLPGADAERFRIGPWNMPEDCNSRVRHPVFHHARQQGKVIVLN